MKKSSTDYQRDYAARQRLAGRVRFVSWVDRSSVSRIKRFIETLEKNDA